MLPSILISLLYSRHIGNAQSINTSVKTAALFEPGSKMASTTRQDFDHTTEAAEVTKQFAAQVKGKTILITGVNKDGIGFPASQALVSLALFSTYPSALRTVRAGLPIAHSPYPRRAHRE